MQGVILHTVIVFLFLQSHSAPLKLTVMCVSNDLNLPMHCSSKQGSEMFNEGEDRDGQHA